MENEKKIMNNRYKSKKIVWGNKSTNNKYANPNVKTFKSNTGNGYTPIRIPTYTPTKKTFKSILKKNNNNNSFMFESDPSRYATTQRYMNNFDFNNYPEYLQLKDKEKKTKSNVWRYVPSIFRPRSFKRNNGSKILKTRTNRR
jgi:hypothetical protein